MSDWLRDLALIVLALSAIPLTVGGIWMLARAHEQAEDQDPPPFLLWFRTAGPEWTVLAPLKPKMTRTETFLYTMYTTGLSPAGVLRLVASGSDASRVQHPKQPERMTDWWKNVGRSQWIALVGSESMMVACLNAGMSYTETQRLIEAGEFDADAVRMLAGLLPSG